VSAPFLKWSLVSIFFNKVLLSVVSNCQDVSKVGGSFVCVILLCLFLNLPITVTCMVSFGDSKHETVKPLQSLLGLIPLKLALSAKCTIHDVTAWCSVIYVIFPSICYYFPVCRVLEQTHSLTSFGFSVGSWGLAMCVAVKRWHYFKNLICKFNLKYCLLSSL